MHWVLVLAGATAAFAGLSVAAAVLVVGGGAAAAAVALVADFGAAAMCVLSVSVER